MEQFKETFFKYLNFIMEQFMSDVQVFNHWWMYLIIPAIFWFIFMVIKFTVLLMPFWLPFRMMFPVRVKKNSDA